jgi:serine/threonine protein kinase
MSDQKYILGEKIARGGMAEIFLGKHVGEDDFTRICVIKRILPHYAQDKEFVQMFRDEAHICKGLKHTNIVRVEGFEEVEGSFAIIMEYVEGADLRTLLHTCENMKARLLVPMACYIIAEAARGLHYAHTKEDVITNQPLGIVHRDISPQNILVSFEGEIKITDFGIADAESKITETRPGVVKGKYSYMSPEQISAKQVDARTDVFALSIVLWEMLHMERLFNGQNEVETIQLVKNCKIKTPTNPNPDINESLSQILARGLAKDVKKRFASASEFEKSLRVFLNKHYPEFTSVELGNFIKKALEKQRKESTDNIKKTLTQTNHKGSGKKSIGRKRSVDLTFDEGSAMNFSIAAGSSKSSTNKRSALSTQSRSTSSARTATQFKPNSARGTMADNKGGWAPKSKKKSSKMMVYSGALALALSFTMYLFTKVNAKSTPPTLTIRTSPSRVKVSIDNKPIKNNNYIVASTKYPLRLNIKPGRHRLKVSREGYRSYQYVFSAANGDAINKQDIILKDRSRPARVMIRVKPKTESVKIDINRGYYVATVGPKGKSVVTPDLHHKRSYKMKVYPNTPSKTGAFYCKFKATALDWKIRNIVTIYPKRKICKVQK